MHRRLSMAVLLAVGCSTTTETAVNSGHPGACNGNDYGRAGQPVCDWALAQNTNSVQVCDGFNPNCIKVVAGTRVGIQNKDEGNHYFVGNGNDAFTSSAQPFDSLFERVFSLPGVHIVTSPQMGSARLTVYVQDPN